MSTEISVSMDGHVATVTIRRPPNNFIDLSLTAQLADALEALDGDPGCRAVVLASEGKHFCAGADFSQAGRRAGDADAAGRTIYTEGIRLLRTAKPIVAAVQGAAVGAGLGLAVVADFRVAGGESRFAANFTRLGYHPGFGLTHTLPRLLGPQRAALMSLTGRRIKPDEALAWGLVDEVAGNDDLRSAARALAHEIAENAPLAVVATRKTLRAGLAAAVRTQTSHEHDQQAILRATEDFQEGVRAVAERRAGNFQGR